MLVELLQEGEKKTKQKKVLKDVATTVSFEDELAPKAKAKKNFDPFSSGRCLDWPRFPSNAIEPLTATAILASVGLGCRYLELETLRLKLVPTLFKLLHNMTYAVNGVEAREVLMTPDNLLVIS